MGMATLLFIGLKLTDYIDWSWWWVLAPLWVVPAFILGVTCLIGLVVVLANLIDGKKAKKNN